MAAKRTAPAAAPPSVQAHSARRRLPRWREGENAPALEGRRRPRAHEPHDHQPRGHRQRRRQDDGGHGPLGEHGQGGRRAGQDKPCETPPAVRLHGHPERGQGGGAEEREHHVGLRGPRHDQEQAARGQGRAGQARRRAVAPPPHEGHHDQHRAEGRQGARQPRSPLVHAACQVGQPGHGPVGQGRLAEARGVVKVRDEPGAWPRAVRQLHRALQDHVAGGLGQQGLVAPQGHVLSQADKEQAPHEDRQAQRRQPPARVADWDGRQRGHGFGPSCGGSVTISVWSCISESTRIGQRTCGRSASSTERFWSTQNVRCG